MENFPFDIQDIGTAINREPNRYSRVGQLGLFSRRPQSTTTATVAFRDGEVVLLDPVARSGPRQELNRDTDTAFTFSIPSFKDGDVLTPEDIQGVVRFAPGPRQLESQGEAYSRLLQRVRRPHDETFEFLRMQALKGRIVSPKGGTLYDLFDVFGLTEKVIDFDLSNANSDVKVKSREIADYMADTLFGENMTSVHALVSSDFYNALIDHPSYKQHFEGHIGAFRALENSRASASDPNPARKVTIEGVTYESYTGQGKNSAGNVVKFIDDGAGHAFPIGTQDVFQEYDAPPNRMNAANLAPNEEIHVYPKILEQEKGVDVDAESCKLPLCTRPDLLLKLNA